MDWVQWYYAITLGLSLLGTTMLGLTSPQVELTQTYSELAVNQPIRIAVALPVIGRVFGWW